jgi:lipopolysaccharide biosynthesis glycosyltransferase
MQDRLRHLVAEAMTTAMSGADEEEGYAHWRELTADLVADAKARFAAPVQDEPTKLDVESSVTAALEGSLRRGPHDDVDPESVAAVVLCFDQNLTHQASVTLQSMLDNASGPVRVWVLGRGLSREYEEWLAAAFPNTPFTFVPCDHIDFGAVARIPARITISTMDRLLLPHLLDGVDRVVYVDIDTVVLGDVCALAGTDLGGRPFASRDSNVSEASEWRAAGRKLTGTLSNELIRRMASAHGYGGAALNAGVLVLDLARMRADDFTRTYLGWVEKYGLHDQDVLLAYAGRERAVLEPRWNALPVLEQLDDPALIHWASLGKPWDTPLTVAKEEWQRYAARLAERVPPPPA